MEILDTPIAGVKIIKPKIFGDSRGFFFESFAAERYARELNFAGQFVQDNISRSEYGVLRGLHYQLQYPQDKLVTVSRGKVFDVVVDVRPNSPTFGQWLSEILDDVDHKQLFIPKGCAHGFCVLSDIADFHYKVSDYYHPEAERGIIWNDTQIKIAWPITEPKLSAKDASLPNLAAVEVKDLPQ